MSDPEGLGNAEDLHHEEGSRIENEGEQVGQERKKQEDRNERSHGAVVALREKLGHRRDAAPEVARQKDQGHREHRDRGEDFPRRHLHAVLVATAVETDELFCGEIGEKEGTADDDPGQAPAREKVPVSRLALVATGVSPREVGDERGEEQEGCQGEHRIE
ncbi:MAG: hypothetical protein WD342_08330 [Verrucomicrobiales bacterium]